MSKVICDVCGTAFAETAEQCIKNMARIGNQGMKDTDAEILAIMTTKNAD